MYRIEFTAAAVRDFKALDKPMQRRVDKALAILKETPRPPKAVRLQGGLHDYHRIRVGDFRIIYLIEDDKLVICVVRIADRKEVYR